MPRDPLSLLPLRYKLPLALASLCFVAYGLGSHFVTTTARDSLQEQIRLRLRDRAAKTYLLVDKALELLERRVDQLHPPVFPGQENVHKL